MIEKAQPLIMWAMNPYNRALSRLCVITAPIRYGRFMRVSPSPWLVAKAAESTMVATKPLSIQLVQFIAFSNRLRGLRLAPASPVRDGLAAARLSSAAQGREPLRSIQYG